MSIERVIAPSSNGSRIIPKPQWLSTLEQRLASVVHLHPNAISGLKLVVTVPLVLSLQQIAVLPTTPVLTLALFAIFVALDYLDGVVARERQLDTAFGRIFDRLTDLPLLLSVAFLCCGPLPVFPVALKLGLDGALLLLFCLGRGPVENRIRTVMSTGTLFVLLAVSQGWAPAIFSAKAAVVLLWTNVAFSTVVVLVRLGAGRLFPKRFIADALSGLNLLCGVASIVSALAGAFPLCLLFLLAGALFDGLDGAAARRWGGTRWGVYSDDVADGINYGIAPGVALGCALGGVEGWVLGVAFSLFTISRLIYFTLETGEADPRSFSGMPSTVGALLVLCAILVFPRNFALVGAMVGVACALMVAFEARFRHLGRLLAARPKLALAFPLVLALLIASYLLFGVVAPAALLLVSALGYGLYPTVRNIGSKVRQARRADA